jgi:hypothetical protein
MDSGGARPVALSAPPAAQAQQGIEPIRDSVIAAQGDGGFPVRYTLRHDVGPGIGYDDSFTTLGMFIPLWEPGDSSLLFCDRQPIVDDNGNFASNAGVGYRLYSGMLDRVFGIYGYFDYRDTECNAFRQGTIGIDSLGTWLDLRANCYIPDQQRMALPTVVVPLRFERDYLIQGYESALSG